MSNYTNLKTAIDAVVKENGRQEITGILLNQTLIAMVNSLGTGYQFMGVATPSTNPGTPDQKVFYIASQLGTYSNFNGIFLGRGIFVLKWDSAWSYETIIAFDATPTVGSNNPIISGAVYTLTQIYVTKLVNDLVNYYRKDETYTQAEIQQIIATIKQFTYETVSSLPSASSATMNKIYLVPSSDPQQQNIKDEYITIRESSLIVFITEAEQQTYGFVKRYWTSENKGQHLIGFYDGSGYTPISDTPTGYTPQEGDIIIEYAEGSSSNILTDADENGTISAQGVPVASRWNGTGWVSIDSTLGDEYYSKFDDTVSYILTKNDWAVPTSYPEDDPRNVNGIIEQVLYRWEQIGSTAIDLSNYYTKAQTEAVINQLINLALQAYTNTTDLNALLAQKQDTLVSGTNIKTINGQSIVGSGNINIDTTMFEFANTLPNPDTAAKNKIYLIPSSDPDAAAQNIKDEYVAVPRTVIYNDVQYPVTLMDSEEIRNVVVLGYMAPVPDASAANEGTMYLHQTNTPPSTTDRINTDGSLILCKEVYTNVFSNVNLYVKIGDAYTVESGANAGIWIRTKTGTNVGWVKVETYYVWELVGSTQINLEDYYTKSEVDALVETEPVANADKLNNIMLMFDLPMSQNDFFTTDNNKHYFYVQPPKSANIDNAAMFADWLVGSSPYHLSVTIDSSDTITFTYGGDNTFVINAGGDSMLDVTCTKVDDNIYQCEVVAETSTGPSAWVSFEIV